MLDELQFDKDGFVRRKFLTKKKIVLVLIVTFVIIISILTFTFSDKLIRQLGLAPLLRKSGLVKVDIPGYFEALKTQNLVYDLSGNGVVGGEDYTPIVEKLEKRVSATSLETVVETPVEDVATTVSAAESQGFDLPSVRFIGNDEFSGSATVNYPIDLPSGTAGLTPSLGLNYSSSTIDDLLVGVKTKWRNDALHSYQRQAGIAGLGWDLGGIQSITRDIKGTLNDPSDDTFMLSFAGGAADLTKESDDGSYSVWRTLPNLNVKVERWARCKTHNTSAGPMVICRYNWIVTAGDGTKYYFGSPTTVANWKRTYDPDSQYFADGTGNDWYPLYDDYDGTRAWMIFGSDTVGWHALTYKWLLSKVESVYDSTSNNIEIKYQTTFELADYKGKKYVAAVYPYKITYGEHQIDFGYQNRFDYKLHDGELATPRQSFIAKQRLRKIVVKTSGKVRKSYILDYAYGWDSTKHNDNGNGIVDSDAEVKSGQAIHSLLRTVTVYNDDPDANANAKYLPAYTFEYGANCDTFKNGCPLKSFVADGGGTQARTPNDFFLRSTTNGYKGKVAFEYYQDATGGNAIPVKYCDSDKAVVGGGDCRQDVANNTQRHRVSAKITYDGTGNSIRTELSYTGSGAQVGLAYVKGNGDEYYQGTNCCKVSEGICKSGQPAGCNCPSDSRTCIQPGDWDCVGGKNCTWSNASCCPSGFIGQSPSCVNPNDNKKYACTYEVTCKSNCKYRLQAFSGFEFLGYPEVTSVTFEKNSTTKVVAKTKNYYFQAIDVAGCFKPNPLRGMLAKSENYDSQNQGRWIENSLNYRVRFGKMFSATYDEKYNWELAGYCTNYDPELTVAQVMTTAQISKSYMPSPSVCTRTATDYNNLDGTIDHYALPHKVTNFGKVNCSTPSQDDTSDSLKMSFTNYTKANETKWILPLTSEAWVSDSPTGTKYNHTRIYYDSAAFGSIGNYGRVTKNETLINGTSYSSSTVAYDTTYPWLAVKTTDPMGRITSTTYDGRFHMFPTSVTNSLGQKSSTIYDFNITDTTHPNYGGVLGLPVQATDVNGASTYIVYDSFGRPIETYLPGRKPGGTITPNQFTKYYYFNESDVSTCNDGTNCLKGLGASNQPKMMVLSATRLSDGGTVGQLIGNHTYYNGLGQDIQKRSVFYANEYSAAGTPVEGEGLKDLISSKTYNGLGQVEYASLVYTASPYVPNGSTSFDTRNFVADGTIKKTNTEYDGFGRTLKTTNPDNTYQKIQYDVGGNPLKTMSQDANCTDGNAATLCTDKYVTNNVFGQTLLTEEIGNGKTYKNSFEYHQILGLATKTIDTNGNVVSVAEYDQIGRKTKMWDLDMSPSMSGDTNSWRYEYDKLGNLVRQTNPKAAVSEIAYDNLNRVLTRKINTQLLVQNTYDTCIGGIGKICKVVSYDLNGKILENVAYEYTNRDLVSKQTKTFSNLPTASVNGQNFVNQYYYDEGGRMIKQTIAGVTALSLPAETIEYQYLNTPNLVTLKGTNIYASSAKYNKNGQLVSFLSGNGVVNSYSYNNDNLRLTNLNVEGSNFAPADKLNLAYTYDPVGNITKISDTNSLHATSPFNLNQNFTYDELYRLTGVSGAYSGSYSYSNVGNILTRNEGSKNASLTYSGPTAGFYHRPQTSVIAGVSNNYTYDAIGNMNSEGTKTYEYDIDNRLTKFKPGSPSGGKETTFLYDAQGTRIAKMILSGRNTYYVSPELEVVVLPDQRTFWRKNYYFLGKIAAVREGPNSIPLTDAVSQVMLPESNVSSASGQIDASTAKGDANADTYVDMSDYASWITNYAQEICTDCPTPENYPDFNKDGKVDGIDFAVWLKTYSGDTSSGP